MKKKYDVYGIGNALVDIVTEVGHGFFAENNIEKGVMTLVDEKRQKALMKAIDMKKSRMSAGGSAANTVIGVNQFGGKSYYSCLVAKDDLGRFFLEDMERNGVDTNLKYEECPPGHTGRCLVMTTPDADRTMNTFLGISSFMSPSHLNEEAIKDAAYAYLEGYLVSSPSGMEALLETKRIAERNKVATALTFSDPNMLRFFSKNFEEVVGASVDLLFCNEEEALMFSETDNLKDARQKLRQAARRFAITLGANGALLFDGDTFIEIEPYKVRALDTNGAGDMFAGAFLYGITHGHSFAEAGKIASLASSRVVSQFGPRLEPQQAQRVLKDLIG
ncbi:MAG: adenosine kinase [Cyclobacteriaceae bacterium]|nr:adenosine kinase [Cyclobacteriaceae bacterium]MCB0499551.1 adenosine kinase [Cyclobacteriaceae bacterium]MCB9238131.1 adenosine kinase [Flammeovirgaceae bacterium]MCW5901545.1 adenosine kinase [Cyclobacteriaceae bacterium]HPI79251.1 adenosine kinase [Cyclobacteriaceae bacterium]